MSIKRLDSKLGSSLSQQKKSQGVDSDRFTLVEDIFGKSATKDTSSKAVKIKLSKTFQQMSSQYQKEIENFLKDHPTIKEKIEKISLSQGMFSPECEGANLTFRKVASYLSWTSLAKRDFSQTEPLEQERIYLEIQSIDKEENLKKIYEKYDQKRLNLHQQFLKESPNYFYRVFPEVYRL